MAEEQIPEAGGTPEDPEAEGQGGAEGGDSEPARDTLESVNPPAGATASGNKAGTTPGQRLAAKKAAKAVEKREARDERKRVEEETRQKEQEEADRLLGRTPPQPALPVEVEKAARTFADFMQDHRGLIVGGIGGALVLAIVALGAQRFMRSGAAEQASELGRALELANAPLDPEDTDGKSDDGKPVFKSEQDRASKSLAALDAVVSTDPNSEAAVWANLAGASELVTLGKFDDARARFQKVYDAHQKEPEVAGRALEGVGIALEAAGKQDDALKSYEQLKSVDGEKQLSAFHVARIKLAKGDREAGKNELKALYDQLNAPAEGEAPSRYLRSEVEVRLAEIDSTLVDKGSSGDANPFGGAGGNQQLTEQQIQKLLEQLQKGGKPPAGE